MAETGPMAAQAPRPADHCQTDLAGAAAVSDRGLRHPDNQDAYAIEVAGRRAVVAVCDGVSSAWRPDLAAGAGARAAVEFLRPLLSGDWPEPLALAATVQGAVAGAEAAVAAVETPDGEATAATLVLAAAGPGVAAVANLGDSRAYWVDADGDHQLVTVDDSWAERAIRGGVPARAAYQSPFAHVITRCLRSDSPETGTPNVAVLHVTGPGLLVLCTDGLWNYAPDPGQVARLAAPARGDGPLAVADRLVQAALDAGGGDNVTVAVIPLDPDGVGLRG